MGGYEADFKTAGFSFKMDAFTCCSVCSPTVYIKVPCAPAAAAAAHGLTHDCLQDAADVIIGAFRPPTCCQHLSNFCCK